jgi:hypothetical protein
VVSCCLEKSIDKKVCWLILIENASHKKNFMADRTMALDTEEIHSRKNMEDFFGEKKTLGDLW